MSERSTSTSVRYPVPLHAPPPLPLLRTSDVDGHASKRTESAESFGGSCDQRSSGQKRAREPLASVGGASGGGATPDSRAAACGNDRDRDVWATFGAHAAAVQSAFSTAHPHVTELFGWQRACLLEPASVVCARFVKIRRLVVGFFFFFDIKNVLLFSNFFIILL